MNALSLQQWVIAFRWVYDGTSIKKQVSKQEAARDNLNGAIIRIGREKLSCNLYLDDSSVSGQHAEIYFNEQQQKFFIKSLSPRNTTKVDGQNLVYGGELPLKNNSTIVLGRQQIEVVNIQVFELESTDYSGIVNSSLNSSPVNSSSNSSQVNPSNSGTDDKSKSWQDRAIVTAIVTAGATILVGLVGSGVTYYTNQQTKEADKYKADQQKEADKYKAELDKIKFYTKFNAEEKKKYQDRLLAHRDKVLSLKKDKPNAYRKLKLINQCSVPVKVAASYTALDEVLEVRGWLVIQPQGDESPGYFTDYSAIHLHAYAFKEDYATKKNEKLIWRGNKINFVTRDVREKGFIYIEDPMFNQNDKPREEKFYRLEFDSKTKNSGRYTTKTFTCSRGSLQLN